MRRLSSILLLAFAAVGCDDSVQVDRPPPVPDFGAGYINWRTPVNHVQFKGFPRSDWRPEEGFDEDLMPPRYRGIMRRTTGPQYVEQAMRVFHMGFHFAPQFGTRGGTVPGYYWGRVETFCTYITTCYMDLMNQVRWNDWVGPVFIVLDFIPPPGFNQEDPSVHTPETQRLYGYPYSSFLYQLELATDMLDRDQIFAPRDLQGDHPTLRDAVLADGWPSLRELNDKYIFILIDKGELRDVYLSGEWIARYEFSVDDPRVFTVADSPEDDNAAFFHFGDDDSPEEARALVEMGFMVHGFGDRNMAQGRRYLDNGAQIVSAFDALEISLPGPARCNPVTAGEQCAAPYEPIDAAIPDVGLDGGADWLDGGVPP